MDLETTLLHSGTETTDGAGEAKRTVTLGAADAHSESQVRLLIDLTALTGTGITFSLQATYDDGKAGEWWTLASGTEQTGTGKSTFVVDAVPATVRLAWAGNTLTSATFAARLIRF